MKNHEKNLYIADQAVKIEYSYNKQMKIRFYYNFIMMVNLGIILFD